MSQQSRENQHASQQRRWQTHVSAAAKSGLSCAEYCRRHNLYYHAMSYWHRKLFRVNTKQRLVPVSLPAALLKNSRQHHEADLRIILPGKISVAVGDDLRPLQNSTIFVLH